MPGYGLTTIGVVGAAIQVLASDFSNASWKPGGCTIDWSTVTAVAGSDVTLTNGTVVKIGQKYMPYGTILNNITGTDTYGPADTTANDGRDVTSRAGSFILNEDLLENPPLGLVAGTATDYVGGLKAGTCWKSRLKVGGVNQPTWDEFEAAFPGVEYAQITQA